MTLTIGGGQLALFLALIAALILLAYALGAVGRAAREYDQDQPGPPRTAPPGPPGPPPAGNPLDLLQAALVIVEHEQEARWAGDLVLRGRLLELEIMQMAEEAERRIGRLWPDQPPGGPAVQGPAGAPGARKEISPARPASDTHPERIDPRAIYRPAVHRETGHRMRKVSL
jgi:hypothetical protein